MFFNTVIDIECGFRIISFNKVSVNKFNVKFNECMTNTCINKDEVK